ncbi:hypothetical protein R6Q59_029527 [Mikania micrantha]
MGRWLESVAVKWRRTVWTFDGEQEKERKYGRKLDGRHVVFGKVLSGMDIVQKIEAEGRQNGTPKTSVIVVDSGELPL